MSSGAMTETRESTRLLSVGEVASELGVGMTTTKLMVHTGEIRSMKVRGRRLIHPEDLADYVERQRRARD